MKYQTNGVACIFKAYAIINLCASVVIALAYDFYGLNILFLASALVASIGIYAIGEIIQLLDNIKQNTAKELEDGTIVTAADSIEEKAPEHKGVPCPNCGADILVPGQKVCFDCGQVLKW